METRWRFQFGPDPVTLEYSIGSFDLCRRQQPGHGDGWAGPVPRRIAYVPACRILGLVVLMSRADLAGFRGEHRFTNELSSHPQSGECEAQVQGRPRLGPQLPQQPGKKGTGRSVTIPCPLTTCPPGYRHQAEPVLAQQYAGPATPASTSQPPPADCRAPRQALPEPTAESVRKTMRQGPRRHRPSRATAPGTAPMAWPRPPALLTLHRRQLEKSVSWSGRERLRCL
jgi:hypothetical protein